jgi:hypothetical protein
MTKDDYLSGKPIKSLQVSIREEWDNSPSENESTLEELIALLELEVLTPLDSGV